MSKNIKVSIIVPVYNVEKYLNECLESAVKQTLNNIEIIIVNDGSTDNSLSIIKEYESKYNNIKVINQTNKGQSEARNVGLSVSNGEYIYFLDSDDYIELTMMEDLFKLAKNKDLDIVHFNAEAFYDDKDTKDTNMYNGNRVFEEDCIYNGEQFYNTANSKNVYRASLCLYFYKKEFIINNELRFYKGILHEDELFSAKSIILADRISYLNKNYFHRRIRSGSIMTSPKGIKNILGYYRVAEELYKFYKLNKDLCMETKILLLKSISEFYGNCIYMYTKLNEKSIEVMKYKETINQSIKEKEEIYNLKNKKLLFKMKLPRTYSYYMDLKKIRG